MKKCCILAQTPENWQIIENSQEGDLLFERIKELLSGLSDEGVEWLLTPMRSGVETMAAQIVSGGEAMKLECVIPYEEQHITLTEAERDRYFGIIEKSQKETLISTRKREESMTLCYEYIVRESDLLIVSEELIPLFEKSGKKIIKL